MECSGLDYGNIEYSIQYVSANDLVHDRIEDLGLHHNRFQLRESRQTAMSPAL